MFHTIFEKKIQFTCTLGETHSFIGSELLLNKKFPLIFESINGECKQEVGGTSHYNEAEVDAVVEWILKLSKTKVNGKQIFSSDIGVISPYKKQCKLIQEDLYNNGFKDISVGTAEIYQGQERRIIIISTVRSDDNLGFVANKEVK